MGLYTTTTRRRIAAVFVLLTEWLRISDSVTIATIFLGGAFLGASRTPRDIMVMSGPCARSHWSVGLRRTPRLSRCCT